MSVSTKSSIGFDSESMGVIADILSTLYSNPERSVLREYVANAIDAHVLSGTKRPVEAELPSLSRPNLVVRDFGTGLSKDAMESTFLRYVNSTKTDRDDQIGALGIGAKSAFAIATSWTVVNVHEGRKYLYVITSNPYGEPTYEAKIDGAATDDLSGITVTIPVSNEHLRHGWVDSAHELGKWFPKNSVKFSRDGSSVGIMHWTDNSELRNLHGCIFKPSRYHSESGIGVVMGGIRYSLDYNTQKTVIDQVESAIGQIVRAAEGDNAWGVYETESKTTRSYANGYAQPPLDYEKIKAHLEIQKAFVKTISSSTFHVGLGDIDFMPSRESVKGTPRTIDAIVAVVVDALRELSSEIVSQRNHSPIDRFPYVTTLRGSILEMSTSAAALFALEIPNTKTDVRGGGKNDDGVFLHRLINLSITGHLLLVTGVNTGKPIHRRRMVEKATGDTIFGINYLTDVDGFGDISPLFKSNRSDVSVMDNKEYLVYAKTVAPVQRRSGGSGMNWYVCEDGVVDREYGDFDTIIEMYADDDGTPVYVVDSMSTYTLESYVQNGFNGVVIEKGRRKEETFSKKLGRDVRTLGQLHADMETIRINHAVATLEAIPSGDLMKLCAYYTVDSDYVDNLELVARSVYGETMLQNHRVHEFIKLVRDGRDFVTRKVNDAWATATNGSASTDQRIIELLRDVNKFDPRPWVLVPSSRNAYGPDELQHAAVYLAAVG